MRNMQTLARDNGFDLEQHTVKVVIYMTNLTDFMKVNEAYKKYFTKGYPARTCVGVQSLPMGGLVEIEFVMFKPA